MTLVSLDFSPREERQLKIVGWCVVVTTAILVEREARTTTNVSRRRSRRRLADPRSTILLKDAQHSPLSYQSERTVSICHSGITLSSSGQGTTSGLS